MKNYYIFQFGYHFGEFISLVFLKNKDENTKFWEFTLHHFVAVALISVSLAYNLVIIGIVVLLCHDPADIVIGCNQLLYFIKQMQELIMNIINLIKCLLSFISLWCYLFGFGQDCMFFLFAYLKIVFLLLNQKNGKLLNNHF